MRGLFGLVLLVWWLFAVSMYVYGVFLSFCASVILGIISIFIAPGAFVFGVVNLFFSVNLPEMIVHWLTTHQG